MNKVLLATDIHPRSDRVLERAAMLASDLDAELHIRPSTTRELPNKMRFSMYVAAIAVAFGVAAANDYGYYPTPTEPPKKCYESGERCLGADNYPYVKYLPCCGENTCTKKDTSYGGYGYLCEAPPKCYKVGQKCIGAPGYPAVPYRECCGDATCTAKAKDWGYVCEAPPKCRPEGQKCTGAPGYPAVPWIECCDGYTCTGKAKDWGMVCAKPAKCYKKGCR